MRNQRRRYLIVLSTDGKNAMRSIATMTRRGKISPALLTGYEELYEKAYGVPFLITNVVEL